MDYRRAQRNLQLVNGNNIDNDLKETTELQEKERHPEEEALISTQVPSLKFSQSSASSPEDNRRIYSSSRISSPVKPMGLIAVESNIIPEVNDEDKHTSVPIEVEGTENIVINDDKNDNDIPVGDGKSVLKSRDVEVKSNDVSRIELAKSDDIVQDDNFLISTQIQSRLDIVNRDSEMKGKLSQFRYATNNNTESTSGGNTATINNSSRLTSGSSMIDEPKQKKIRTCVKKKEVTKLTRAQDLLKKLSGKHRKVRDILKGQQEADKKKPRGKIQLQPSKSFDVYNAEEWKNISCQILKNFPRSNTQDVKDIFCYLYGDCDALDMWGSSQKPPEELMSQYQPNKLHLTQNKKNDSASSTDMMKLLSLSQVMEDTTDHEKSLLIVDENVAENINSCDEQSFYITQENTVHGDGIDLRNFSHDSVVDIPDKNLDEDKTEAEVQPPNKKTDAIEIESNSISEMDDNVVSNPTRVNEHDSNCDEDIIFYDSMDEMRVEFPTVEQHKLNQFNFVPPSPTLIPLNETLTKPTKDYKDDEIDLTQASFTVSNELISPIKPETVIPKESTPRKVGDQTSVTGTIQVPATRAPTLSYSDKLYNVSRDEYIVNARLSNVACERVRNGELPFKFPNDSNSNSIVNSDDTIIYDSDVYNYKNLNCDEDKERNIFELKYSAKQEIQLETSEPPIELVSESKRVENVIVSQSSAQDLRRQMKEIGLRPVRTKSEMISSLESASQILGTTGVAGNFSTRQVLYDHLTKLIKNEPSLLERIQTFQPILLEEFMYELNELDPLVNLIDESTIQSWVDANGVSLKRS